MDTNAQEMEAQAETIRRRAAPRSAFNWIVRGRSPGSEVLTHRLPGFLQWHSDTFTLPYRCGGSTGLVSRRTCFPFHPGFENPAGTADEVGGL